MGFTYWGVNPQENEDFHLPEYFNREYYKLMESFFGKHPICNPLHQRDTQNPCDKEHTIRSLKGILQIALVMDEEPTIDDDNPITQYSSMSM